MKQVVPNYYDSFTCIADRCRHNCCIGWEIDIDPETYEKYKKVPGDFGVRLRCGISCGETPCFRLGDGDRCVFLNDRGLCDIILNLGEDALCDICTLHPRFRNFFDDRTELGLGLCCEEACRIILGQEEVTVLCGSDSAEDSGDAEFFADRDRVFEILQDRSMTLSRRFDVLSDEFDISVSEKSPAEWAEFYRGLERLDPAWDRMLDRLSEKAELVIPDNTIWEKLMVYIVYRHSASYGIADSVAFAMHTAYLLCTICGDADFDDICDLCRMWSCEIEYSEENTDAVGREAPTGELRW